MAREGISDSGTSESESEWQEVEPSAREAALLSDLPLNQTPTVQPAPVISSQPLEIVITHEQHEKKRKKQNFFERAMATFRRELRVNLHKVHLLCLLVHAQFLSNQCDSQEIQALLVSLTPPVFAVTELSDLRNERTLLSLLRWFHSAVDNVKLCTSSSVSLRYSSVQLLVALLRGLGLRTRLVLALDPYPLKEKSKKSLTMLKKENESSKNRKEKKSEAKHCSEDVQSPSTSSSCKESPLSRFQWESPTKRQSLHQHENPQDETPPLSDVQGRKKQRRGSEQKTQVTETATAVVKRPNRSKRGGGGRRGRGGRGRGGRGEGGGGGGGRGGGGGGGGTEKKGNVEKGSLSSSAYFEQTVLTTDKDSDDGEEEEEEEEEDSDGAYSPSHSPAAKKKRCEGRRVSRRLAGRLVSRCEGGHHSRSGPAALGSEAMDHSEDDAESRLKNKSKGKRVSEEIEEEEGDGSLPLKRRRVRKEKCEKQSSTGGKTVGRKRRGEKNPCLAGDEVKRTNPVFLQKGSPPPPERYTTVHAGSLVEQEKTAVSSPQDEVREKDGGHVPLTGSCSPVASSEEESVKGSPPMYGETGLACVAEQCQEFSTCGPDEASSWVEVYMVGGKWCSLHLPSISVGQPQLCEKHCAGELSYVVAVENVHRVKDVTARYAYRWCTQTQKSRVDTEWWAETLKPFSPLDEEVEEEEEDIKAQLFSYPFPVSVQDFKNHPLYALKRHLLKFEAIFPPESQILGYFRGEPIYSRDCVHVLHTRETWLKDGRVVKKGEKPYNVVKGRKKKGQTALEAHSNTVEVFGKWQTEDYVPPPVVDGIVPRNEYGNVELFKASMLPPGAVHMTVPGIGRVARKLEVDFAPAMMGWDFHGGTCYPIIDGIVVAKEWEGLLLEAWQQEQELVNEKQQQKREKRVVDRWIKLTRGLLIRERVRKRFSYHHGHYEEEEVVEGREEESKRTD